MSTITSIGRAVEAIGGQTAMARAVGVSQGLVWQWCNGRLRIPAERCRDIVAATKGAVTLSDLRPDIWPPEGEGQRDAA